MPSSPSKASLIFPILLITFGVGWLLRTLEVAPEIDWTWTLGLAVLGVLLLVVVGVDKVTIVCAPLLLVSSILSVFHQLDALGLGILVPILVILTGSLLLLTRSPHIPSPKWLAGNPGRGRGN